MQAFTVVKDLDVFKDCTPSLISGSEMTWVNQFFFEGSPEALDDSVVVFTATCYFGHPSCVGIVATSGNPQKAAHQSNGELALVVGNKVELHGICLAKYVAAFFSIATSISKRLFSSPNCLSSASPAVGCACLCPGCHLPFLY